MPLERNNVVSWLSYEFFLPRSVMDAEYFESFPGYVFIGELIDSSTNCCRSEKQAVVSWSNSPCNDERV